MQRVFSNDLNTLVETVANVLSAESYASPLAPDWLIVPNQDTGRWLQIKLTDRLGSLANTEVTTLSEFMWKISDAQPDRQLESDLYWAIATVWRRKHPKLAEPDHLQQVHTLFKLFQHYLAERPDWLVTSQKTSVLPQPPDTWQIELWREIEHLLPAAPHQQLISALRDKHSKRLDSVARVVVARSRSELERFREVLGPLISCRGSGRRLLRLIQKMIKKQGSPYFDLDGGFWTSEFDPIFTWNPTLRSKLFKSSI